MNNTRALFLLVSLFFLVGVLFFLGAFFYSWDENKICPFGKDTYKSTDYDKPILVDTKGDELSASAQQKILKSASDFSQNLINQTYDTAKILCQQKYLNDEQYQHLLVSTNLYAKAVAVPAVKWDNNGVFYQSDFYRALSENDEGMVITTTLCIVGICTKSELANFCKTNVRPYLKNKVLNKKLMEFYFNGNKVNITYPFDKTLSKCSGLKY